MDEFIDQLLNEERVCDVILPRLQKRSILEDLNALEPRQSILDEDLEDINLNEEVEAAGDGEKGDSKDRKRDKYRDEEDGENRRHRRHRDRHRDDSPYRERHRDEREDRRKDRDDRDRREKRRLVISDVLLCSCAVFVRGILM